MQSNIIKNILVSTVLFLAIDSVYLTLSKTLFNTLVKSIQGNEIKLNLDGAIFAYLCIVLIFNYFIIQKNGGLMDAFLLGLLTYGIFEGTNRAIFSKWSVKAMIIDTVWGGILFASVLYFFRIVIKKIP
tara:strand:- start:264 stop:650 length:387 start_codon:yes stop_codon:yes gene_type:complete